VLRICTHFGAFSSEETIEAVCRELMTIYRQPSDDLVHLARALKHSSVDPPPANQSTPSWLAQKANLPVLS